MFYMFGPNEIFIILDPSNGVNIKELSAAIIET